MEEAPVVDCPPTPEILPVAGTPPPQVTGEVVCSSSSEETEGTSATTGRQSPPQKCAICLGKCRQRAFSDACAHEFCFRCLLEWSKVKPECPLCKQRFYTIVYHKAIDRSDPRLIHEPITSDPRERNRELYNQLNTLLDSSPRYSYQPTPRYSTNSERLQQLLLHQSSEVDRFIREYGNERIPSRRDDVEWRRFVYANGLYALPLPDINGRYRESSATFYQENHAQLHRVMAWLHRELRVVGVLIPGMSVPDEQVMEDLMLMYDIDSRHFLVRIVRHIQTEHVDHFQHELNNFARSPYDMVGYDRWVQYNPRFAPRRPRNQQVIISSSEEDNDDIVYMPEPTPAADNGGSSGEMATNGSSTATTTATTTTTTTTSTTITTNVSAPTDAASSSASGAGNEAAAAVPAAPIAHTPLNAHGATRPPVPASMYALRENILLSSSDSDECQFVLAQKPPHLRTPDHVVDLESASDSDVVFVAEGTSQAARQQQPGSWLKKETAARAANHEYNNGASTSSGYCGGCGKGTATVAGGIASAVTAAIRTRNYERQPVTRHTGGTGVKMMYETDDTGDSDSEGLAHGNRYTSTLSDSSSHEQVVFSGSVQRKRKRPSRKSAQPKPTKRVSRRRRSSTSSSCSSSSSSSSSSDCSSSSDSDEQSSSSSNSSSRSSSTSSNANGNQLPKEQPAKRQRRTGRPLKKSTKRRPKQSSKPNPVEKRRCKRAKETAADDGVSKSKSTPTKKKPRVEANPGHQQEKPKRTGRSSSARRGRKAKKRTRLPAPATEEVPTDQSTAHYVIASRPSLSPTTDVTTIDDGVETRKRKLKSVIIKRCHFNNPSATMGEATNEGSVHGTPSQEEPSTSRLGAPPEAVPLTDVTDVAGKGADHSGGASSDSTESELPTGDWSNSGTSAITAASTNQTIESESFSVAAQYVQEQLSLPTAEGSDQQQHHSPHQTTLQTAADMLLLVAEETSTTNATNTTSATTSTSGPPSESLFEPSLSWVDSGDTARTPLLPDDRALSSAAASPFSSISFPPSTATSVSPTPSLSSQSLVALPTAVASPLQLIEGLATLDDGDSPLPSSVVAIDAIDRAAIDEIIAAEDVHQHSTTEPPQDAVPNGGLLGAMEETGEAGTTVTVPCGLVPPSATAGGMTIGAQLQL